MTTKYATFDDAIRAIRLAAAAADPMPHDLPVDDYKRGKAISLMPRRSFSFPVPGNPRGMTISAVDRQETLSALADRLEKSARAFGGTPPKRDRSPLNTRGIVAARNAHAEGHRNAAHRALGGRLYIDMYGTPYAVVSQMQAAGQDILLCRSIAARSNDIRAIHAASGACFATNKQKAEFNDFCTWLAARAEACSDDLPVMPSMNQPDALAEYLAGDTVEAIDPDAEPCDTAAAIARAEASAKPEPEPGDAAIHSGDDAPAPLAEPADHQSIPDFANAREADSWWRNRATSYPSQAAYRATPEYASFVAKTAPLYARDKSSASATMAEAMKAAGVTPGDRVATAQAGSYLNTTTLTGTVVMRGGMPWVNLDETIYVSRKGRVSDASRVRWSPAWQPIQEAESTEPGRDPAGHTPTASPATATATATATPRLPHPHQKLAQVPDQNAAHGAGSRIDAKTQDFTRTDSAPVGTYPVNRLSRHRTRWRPRRTEDGRRNPLQAGLIRNHNARRWREPWDSVAIDPPRTRTGSIPPIHAVATGDRGSYPHHHSIECRYLSMARKLHKPPDQKATHAAGSRRQCQETGSSPPLHHITRASRGLTITKVDPTK